MTDRPVRVRIGPSPTGEPHVGTAYIALFNLAFARKHGGQFVLRVEDTDQDRSRPEWEQQIIEGLEWLGLKWDEGPDVGGPHGPYRQSERKAIYEEHIWKLVDAGKAYRCFATKEELDELRARQIANKERQGYDRRHRNLSEAQIQGFLHEGRSFVIRLATPLDGETVVKDRLRGEVRFANEEIDDQILFKSDGFPTYHLANVVDDHLMGISHVIRAEEWISSTPKHVLLYEAFGWEAPEFVHMPLLRNADKSKISKRKNPVSIMDYRQRGFVPEAVVNYLALLGMTMPDEREVFDFDEFVAALDFDRVHLGGPVFDLEKFTWLNGKYFRERLSEEELLQLLQTELLAESRLREIIPLIRERIDKGEDFVPATSYFFSGDLETPAAELLPKKRGYKETAQALEGYVEAVDKQVDFSADALEAMSRGYGEKIEWKPRDLFMPVRVAKIG
ncbi:MAG: glutamate--tRNA ligase, partial [Myxococcota bacterium]